VLFLAVLFLAVLFLVAADPALVPVAAFAFPGARAPRRRLWNPRPVHRYLAGQ
jgi:hypothetical protein